MSGDFGSFAGLGLDPEMMRKLAEQWQAMQAAQQAQAMGGMDMAKMGAPAMPLPAPGGQAVPSPTPAPSAPAEPVVVGDPRQEQAAGLMQRLMGGGLEKGPDGERRQPDMMAALRGLGGGAARPAAAAPPASAPAPAPPSRRPQGGGALPMREATPGNPYLRRRRGLLGDE